jgi:hypothetical protein
MLLMTRFSGGVRLAIGRAIVGITAYAALRFAVDVPMSFGPWQADATARL